MLKKLHVFSHADDGAVTVDWVVLTAAVVGLGFAAIVSISGASGSVGTTVQSFLNAITIG